VHALYFPVELPRAKAIAPKWEISPGCEFCGAHLLMKKKKKQFGRHSIYWKTTKRRRNARVTADLNPRIPKLQAANAEIVFVYEPAQQL
jgi:hypothetical protein